MSILNKKENICGCGRRCYGFKKCQVCRSKQYAEKAKAKKHGDHGGSPDFGIDLYYNRHIGGIIKTKPKCAECGCGLPSIPSRTNVAHILPKRIFKSVADLHENCIYLCWQCHHDFDSTYERAQKMKIWPIVRQKVVEFRHLVKERHKILSYFD